MADYKQFNLWYWKREEDGSYTRKLDTFETWQEASEAAFELIKDIDVFNPELFKYRLEKIEAVWH